MNWAELELKRIEDDQKFIKKITLAIAMIGSFIADMWAIYFTQYSLEIMETHPNEQDIFIFLVIQNTIIVTINVLTFLYYLNLKKEPIPKEVQDN